MSGLLIKLLVAAGIVSAAIAYHVHSVGSARDAGYKAGDIDGAARVQALFDTFKGEQITKTEALIADAKAQSTALREDFAQRSKELKNETSRIARERDAALASLRQRAERPAASSSGGRADVSADTTTGSASAGCTGAELYRPDAEILVREAARAELIRHALLKCYADFDAARERLDAFAATER